MKIDQIQIRPPKPSDLNFIQSTFSKCIKKESSLGRACSTKIFFSEFHGVIDYLLSNASISIACSPDDESVIFGYLIHEPKTIHFIYVKAVFRNLHVAKELIESAFQGEKTLKFSFSTNDAKRIQATHPNLIYNPFSLYVKGIAA